MATGQREGQGTGPFRCPEVDGACSQCFGGSGESVGYRVTVKRCQATVIAEDGREAVHGVLTTVWHRLALPDDAIPEVIVYVLRPDGVEVETLAAYFLDVHGAVDPRPPPGLDLDGEGGGFRKKNGRPRGFLAARSEATASKSETRGKRDPGFDLD